MLWIQVFTPQRWKYVTLVSGKLFAGMALLAFYYGNLARHMIGTTMIAGQFPPVSTGMADLVILFSTAVWIYGADVLKQFSEMARALYWILLAVTPVLVFLIVELCWNPSVTGISLLNGELNVLVYLILEILLVCANSGSSDHAFR